MFINEDLSFFENNHYWDDSRFTFVDRKKWRRTLKGSPPFSAPALQVFFTLLGFQ